MNKKLLVLFTLPLLSLTACGKNVVPGENNCRGDLINAKIIENNMNSSELAVYGNSSFNAEVSSLACTGISSISRLGTSPFVVFTYSDSDISVFNMATGKMMVGKSTSTATVCSIHNRQFLISLSTRDRDGTPTSYAEVYDQDENLILSGFGSLSYGTGNYETDIYDGEEFVTSFYFKLVDTVSHTFYANYKNVYNSYSFKNVTVDHLPCEQFAQGKVYLPIEEYYPLAIYGHPEIVLSEELSTYYFYKTNGSLIASFNPIGYGNMAGVVGEYLYFLQDNVVNEYAEDFTYYYNNSGTIEKHIQKVTRFNYTNGDIEEVDLGYRLVTSFEPIFDEDHFGTIGLANIQKISSDKTLDNTQRTYVVDEDLELHDDITGIDFSDLVKFGDNYLDESTGIVYNSSLEEVNYITTGSSYHNQSFAAIKDDSGLYGVADADGRLIVPCIYTEIALSDMTTNKVLAVNQNNEILVLELNAKKYSYTVLHNLKQEGYEYNSNLGDNLFTVLDSSSNEYLYNASDDTLTPYVASPSFTPTISAIYKHIVNGKAVTEKYFMAVGTDVVNIENHQTTLEIK